MGVFTSPTLLHSMSFLKLRQFWSSKRESWGQALASVRRVANIVNITSKGEEGEGEDMEDWVCAVE